MTADELLELKTALEGACYVKLAIGHWNLFMDGHAVAMEGDKNRDDHFFSTIWNKDDLCQVREDFIESILSQFREAD